MLEARDGHRPQAAADPIRSLEERDRPIRAGQLQPVCNVRPGRPGADDREIEDSVLSLTLRHHRDPLLADPEPRP